MDRDTSEIAKLAERIAKDPKSKLFVPLAEEYKKTGDIEMAIHVLMEGLKNNPGYVTARSFLGRLLIENGDLVGAQKELEDVIKAIPDNLLAQKKLGELYALQGNMQDALARFRMVIMLNPKDHDVITLISDIEAGRDITGKLPKLKVQKQEVPAQAPAAPAKQQVAAPAQKAQAPLGKPQHAAPQSETVIPPTAPAPPSASAEKPVTAMPQPQPAAAQEQPPAVPMPGATAAPPLPTQPETKIEETAPQDTLAVPGPEPAPGPADAGGGFDFLAEGKLGAGEGAIHGLEVSVPGGFFEDAPQPPGTPAEQPTERQEITAFEGTLDAGDGTIHGLEVSVPGGFFEDAAPPSAETPEETEAAGVIVPEAPVSEALPPSAEPFAKATGTRAEREAPAAEPLNRSDDFTTDTLAELYITQGFYDKAIDIYERMLSDNPGHQGLTNKLAHLRQLAGGAEEPAAGVPLQHEEPASQIGSFDISEGTATEPAQPGGGGREYVPPPFIDEQEAQPADTGSDILEAGSMTSFPGLETQAREYVPPQPEPHRKGAAARTEGFDLAEPASPFLEKADAPPPIKGPKPAGAVPPVEQGAVKKPDSARKDTINRLELWLKNVAKEK